MGLLNQGHSKANSNDPYHYGLIPTMARDLEQGAGGDGNIIATSHSTANAGNTGNDANVGAHLNAHTSSGFSQVA